MDFARFVILTKQFNEPNWQRWPKAYRLREEVLLNQWTLHHQEPIKEVVFQQFIFSEQWQQLKAYANHRGVDILGDMPIYISYHSADVWAHPELFRLKPDKSMEVVAGVPPDYFNENGQLWGMPLFDWKVMEENGYDWWLKRIGKNLEWFDLLRLDHFRGFSAFWEVPAQSETAIHGKWIKGPGFSLFDAIQKSFPQMPFVAEDLGKIDQDVYDLRDRYGLPGMKVIQFGFDENMPFLDHAPCNHTYNSIVYTGTHDNNTVKGWFRHEAGKATLKRFKQFTGLKMTHKNCCREMIRVAYASTAKLAVIPMQDWLALDEQSRMNFPATTNGNWRWRMKPDQLTPKLRKQILKMVKVFGRY
jgi:4-alpha-glucanotransferase